MNRPENAAPCTHFYPNTLSCYKQADADCNECPHLIIFNRHSFCGYCPPRVTPHDIIRGNSWRNTERWKRCITCANYTKKLSSAVCEPCLVSENLCNHKLDIWMDIPTIRADGWTGNEEEILRKRERIMTGGKKN